MGAIFYHTRRFKLETHMLLELSKLWSAKKKKKFLADTRLKNFVLPIHYIYAIAPTIAAKYVLFWNIKPHSIPVWENQHATNKISIYAWLELADYYDKNNGFEHYVASSFLLHILSHEAILSIQQHITEYTNAPFCTQSDTWVYLDKTILQYLVLEKNVYSVLDFLWLEIQKSHAILDFNGIPQEKPTTNNESSTEIQNAGVETYHAYTVFSTTNIATAKFQKIMQFCRILYDHGYLQYNMEPNYSVIPNHAKDHIAFSLSTKTSLYALLQKNQYSFTDITNFFTKSDATTVAVQEHFSISEYLQNTHTELFSLDISQKLEQFAQYLLDSQQWGIGQNAAKSGELWGQNINTLWHHIIQPKQ
jgi:hypothetical protein